MWRGGQCGRAEDGGAPGRAPGVLETGCLPQFNQKLRIQGGNELPRGELSKKNENKNE